jgi:hypothetical protein
MNRSNLGTLRGLCENRQTELTEKIRLLDSERKVDYVEKGWVNVLIQSEKEILMELELLFSIFSTVIENILAEDQPEEKERR